MEGVHEKEEEAGKEEGLLAFNFLPSFKTSDLSDKPTQYLNTSSKPVN